MPPFFLYGGVFTVCKRLFARIDREDLPPARHLREKLAAGHNKFTKPMEKSKKVCYNI